MIQSNKKILYAPWNLFVIYIIITMFLNIFGPWDYVNYNKIVVIVYMTLFLAISTFAFKYAINKSIYKNRKLVFKPNLKLNPLYIAKSSILISLFLYLYLLYEKFVMFGPPGAQDSVFETINNAYNSKEFIFTRSYWLYSYLMVFDIFSRVLGLYYFKKLSLNFKILFLLNLTLFLMYTIFYDGNQKALGDLVITLISVIALLYVKTSIKIKLRHLISIFSMVIISLYFLMINLSERISGWGWKPYTLDGLAYANYDHWMIRYLPEELQIGGMALFNYISNGYYGLSLSLQLPFEWSMGFGSSFAFREIITRWFNIHELAYGAPYPERMQEVFGYDGYVNWVSIFPWLASDFTFFGAILLIALFVYIYALSWYNSVNYGNWISIVMFAHLNLFLVFVPNNNQLFQSKSSLIATLVIFVLWILFKDIDNDEYLEKQKNN